MSSWRSKGGRLLLSAPSSVEGPAFALLLHNLLMEITLNRSIALRTMYLCRWLSIYFLIAGWLYGAYFLY